MELYLPNGWYLINPREIKSVEYFLIFNGNKHSPDEKYENLISHYIKRENYKTAEEYARAIEDNINKFKEIKIKKHIRIIMNDTTDGYGKREQNILNIEVDDDDLFNYIYKNLSRKFNLCARNKIIEENNIKKLYEKGLTKEEIAKILHIKFTFVEKIIEEYKIN